MKSLSLPSLPFTRYYLHSPSVSSFFFFFVFLFSSFWTRTFFYSLTLVGSCYCYGLSASERGTNTRWVSFKTSNLSPKTPTLSRVLCLRAKSYGGVGDGDAVIIVDHGSRRKESNLLLNEFVEMFKHKTGYEIVEPAHMELAEPSIRDAFQSCVEQGAQRVVISPFFLSPGRHWNQDIPSLSSEAAKEHPGVSYIVTAPLGLHELLVDVVNDRIKHCLKHISGDADECSVCAGTGKCRLYNS